VSPAGEDATDAELEAVFGPRAAYYVGQWRGTASRRSNWAAFFWSGFWLPYRRLYTVALLFYAAVVGTTILTELVFRLLGYSEVPHFVDRLGDLAFALAVGGWGNRWYFGHISKVLAEARAMGLGPDEHLRELARRGGTRPWHAVGFGLLFFIAFLAAGLVLAVGELVMEGSGLKR